MFGYIWEMIKYHAHYPFAKWIISRRYFDSAIAVYDGLFDRLGERDDLIDFLINRMYEVGGRDAFENMPADAVRDLANHFGVDTFDIAEEIRDPYNEEDRALAVWEGEGGSYAKS